MNTAAFNLQSSDHGHVLSSDHSLYLEQLVPPAGPSAWMQEEMLFAGSPVVENSGFGSFSNCDDLYPMMPWQSNQVPCWEFQDLDDICGDFEMWAAAQDISQSFFDEDAVAFDAKRLTSISGGKTFDHRIQSAEKVATICWSSSVDSSEERSHNGRHIKSSGLQFEEIRKYFDVPITKAAKELRVGLTVLKKRCRELNIRRWPHRKIKSLKFLIQNAKDLGLKNEVEMLEEHQRMLHRLPEMELTERTKKLRQSCFKANYKKRRALAMAAAPGAQC